MGLSALHLMVVVPLNVKSISVIKDVYVPYASSIPHGSANSAIGYDGVVSSKGRKVSPINARPILVAASDSFPLVSSFVRESAYTLLPTL